MCLKFIILGILVPLIPRDEQKSYGERILGSATEPTDLTNCSQAIYFLNLA